ncbi:hypothetical protein K437DRAFT_267914 [Tilletiaria anomala UBC 951]|uniref:Carboxymuconolactone decarboxylase-like domain-containing protein n=1 Tax=Tilletiaria anomala (strain ATCC 24038 / CBS 436.72 / UBC 951) TaxID=1037660 RepID=A0A066VZH2_TILAU|nr:uncharacterized protein K437DRAFT_267914 [Tilletiaria anomala UBC 951]KDN47137.1 hypothetical protein K437DRAFT_267914 [Tilletiaria anomala UBC 951]
MASIDESFGNCQDLVLLTFPINYGLILSNCKVIDLSETELVILAALALQNRRPETLWHLRGSRRAGSSDKAIESVRIVYLDIPRCLSKPTYKAPTLQEVSETSDGK